jgi:hypothetical protein
MCNFLSAIIIGICISICFKDILSFLWIIPSMILESLFESIKKDMERNRAIYYANLERENKR